MASDVIWRQISCPPFINALLLVRHQVNRGNNADFLLILDRYKLPSNFNFPSRKSIAKCPFYCVVPKGVNGKNEFSYEFLYYVIQNDLSPEVKKHLLVLIGI